MQSPSANVRRGLERRFVRLLALACVVLAACTTLYATLTTPAGTRYTGFQTNVDDHMVYAAWTWQAAHGALTFDDRFAVDPQPGLTFHLYFLILGQIARFTGVVAAMHVGRLLGTGLFVFLLARLVRRLRPSLYGAKLALFSAIVAGGVGFLPMFWHRFDTVWPIDVWQPEGFVVPSMLTNGLFMVALCLILAVFLCVLQARRKGWRAVALGALAMAVLMNVHSYDALLVGLVLLGFLVASLVERLMTAGWAVRATLIVLGALPPALWFVHVLKLDAVFAARAATETYSPNFRLVVLGLLPPMALAFAGLYRRIQRVLPGARNEREGEPWGRGSSRRRRLAGLALAVLLFVALLAFSTFHKGGYFLTPPLWAVAFVVALAATTLLAERSPARNLVVAWALVGTVAIYFPALFQRKLSMGLAIPWGLLAGLAIESFIRDRERSARNLATAVALLVMGLSSLLWTFREIGYAAMNVASTARHPVYLGPDAQKIVAYLGGLPGRHVVATLATGPQPARDEAGNPVPDTFVTPAFPDIAPFLTGLAGVYTVAGHWSETPDYGRRASASSRFLLTPENRGMTDAERTDFIQRYGVDYAVVPVTEGAVKPESLGEVVVPGTQFELVKLGPLNP